MSPSSPKSSGKPWPHSFLIPYVSAISIILIFASATGVAPWGCNRSTNINLSAPSGNSTQHVYSSQHTTRHVSIPLAPATLPSEDHILFLQHIPKTGGTTLILWLESVVAPLVKRGWCHTHDWLNSMEEDMTQVFDKEGVPKCGFYHKEARNEHVESVLETTSKVPVLRFVLLRDPFAHVLSAMGHEIAYGNVKNKSQLDQKIIRAVNGDCKGPGEDVICTGYNLRNQQTLFISGHTPFGKRTANETMAGILQKIDKYFYVGITEFMHASQCMLLYQIGKFNRKKCDLKCGTVDAQPVARNRNKSPGLSFTYEQLSMLHSLIDNDVVLYAHAVELFRQRVSWIEREENVELICDDLNLP